MNVADFVRRFVAPPPAPRTLCETLGLPPLEDVEGEELEELYGVVLELALTLLRGRVAVSVGAWAGFTLLEREALAEAGDRLRALEAVDATTAGSGPAGMAEVLARVDGGAARSRVALEAHAGRLEQRVSGGGEVVAREVLSGPNALGDMLRHAQGPA